MPTLVSSNGSKEEGRAAIVPGAALPNEALAICGVGVRWPGDIRTSGDFWEWSHMQEGVNGSGSTNGNGAKGANGHVDKAQRLNGHHDRESNGVSDGASDQHWDGFDAAFFSLSDAEAASWTSPQKRALEVVYECLEDAGEIRYGDEDALVGCYLAVDHLDGVQDRSNGNGSNGSGANHTALRLSKVFGFRGPW